MPTEAERIRELEHQLYRREREVEKLQTELRGAVLLDRTGLADALGKHPNYVTEMKAAGFPMPGYRATLADAKEWIQATGFTRTGGVKNGEKRSRTKRRRRGKLSS